MSVWLAVAAAVPIVVIAWLWVANRRAPLDRDHLRDGEPAGHLDQLDHHREGDHGDSDGRSYGAVDRKPR